MQRIQSIEREKKLVDLLHAGTFLGSTREGTGARETSRTASATSCTTRSAIEFLHDRAKEEYK